MMNLKILTVVLIFALNANVQKTFANEEKAEQMQTSEEFGKAGVYVLVSFSMNDSALQSYFNEAGMFGAKLVMRGLKDNSFLETKAKTDILGINFEINPVMFEEFKVDSVPVIIQIDEKGGLKKIAGHISIKDAIEIMKDEQRA